MKEKNSKIGKLILLFLLRIAVSQIFLVLFCVTVCLIPAWVMWIVSDFQMFINFAIPLLIVAIIYFEFHVRKNILPDSERRFYVNTINEKIKEIKAKF